MCTLSVRYQPWACIMGRSEGEAKVLSSALGIKTKHKAMLAPSVIPCCPPALHRNKFIKKLKKKKKVS